LSHDCPFHSTSQTANRFVVARGLHFVAWQARI
jgi:hypothetical protein